MLVFSFDGKLIVSKDSDRNIKVWSLKRLIFIFICKEYIRVIILVVFIFDSKFISSGKDGKLMILYFGDGSKLNNYSVFFNS